MFARHYSELEIYQIAIRLDKEIDIFVKKIPYYWQIPEVDQILRSSDSVPSNVVEGFSHRFYLKKFHHYLNIALGSSDETQKHLTTLNKKCHIFEKDYAYYFKEYKNLSIKILNFVNCIRKRLTCHPPLGPQ